MHVKWLAIVFFWECSSYGIPQNALSSSTMAADVASGTMVHAPSDTLTVPAPRVLHGIGFSRFSSFDEPRAYQKARKNALMDLAASKMTSVYLEYYATNTLPTQLTAEFAIADLNSSQHVHCIDSLRVGDWAVYLVQEAEETTSLPEEIIHQASSLPWLNENFEPVNLHGFWLSAGHAPNNAFNPNRSWILAKQDALKHLSLFLSTVVQSNQREFDNTYRSIHYITSKYIFHDIGVISRRFSNNQAHVLVAVKEENAYNLKN